MLIKTGDPLAISRTANIGVRQSTAGVFVLVVLLHACVLYSIAMQEIKLPEVVVKQQAIEVKIIQKPAPPPVIRPPEPPEITKPAVQPSPPVAAPSPAKVAKITKVVTKPPVSTQQPVVVQDAPQVTAKPASTPAAQLNNAEQVAATDNRNTASHSEAVATDSSQKTAGPPNRAASTQSRSGCSAPVYPEESALNGDEGTTTLALLIGEDGKVLDAKIERSSGFSDLDRAARKALVLCTFQPATSNGQPQQSWAKLSWKWQLKN